MKNYNLVLFMALVLFACSCAGQSANTLSQKDFQNKMKQPSTTLLDVRTREEFKAGHLDKSMNIDINDPTFGSQCAKLDKGKPILVYCLGGKRSNRAADMLRNKGFKVHVLDGGFDAWQKAGLPVAK
jgi:thioredoxin 1